MKTSGILIAQYKFVALPPLKPEKSLAGSSARHVEKKDIKHQVKLTDEPREKTPEVTPPPQITQVTPAPQVTPPIHDDGAEDADNSGPDAFSAPTEDIVPFEMDLPKEKIPEPEVAVSTEKTPHLMLRGRHWSKSLPKLLFRR